ncbi:DUF305 domain-containing protein [Nocardioides sp. STR2]|uniref:DUF305 domain-containing protein n=1 Tax=Nocardioides pini TaxID=2975053 RepID=A0ABT4C860_9ACTN|nr:DUF305 domain-containing protein [Nocardioides pini]MCY4725136.1 DUF305 domain-containing protein [Nocardioides pini]
MLGRLSRPLAAVVTGLALTLSMSACTSDQPDAGAPASAGDDGSPDVLQPGGPGEENATISPEDAEKAVEPEFNEADVAFMQMMVPHHAQAIVMAELADKHARSDRVRELAARIRAAQGPEILMMAAWLEERDMAVPTAAEDPSEWDHSQHGHNGMVGMLTDAQMEKLERARGAAFDRLFLRYMIQHHYGAIDMADDVAVDGIDIMVSEVAADVAVTQTAEIDRLQETLDRV